MIGIHPRCVFVDHSKLIWPPGIKLDSITTGYLPTNSGRELVVSKRALSKYSVARNSDDTDLVWPFAYFRCQQS